MHPTHGQRGSSWWRSPHVASNLEGPGEWQPYFERVRDASRAIEASGTLMGAARRSVDLAAACADCHADVGARPVFDIVVSRAVK